MRTSTSWNEACSPDKGPCLRPNSRAAFKIFFFESCGLEAVRIVSTDTFERRCGGAQWCSDAAR